MNETRLQKIRKDFFEKWKDHILIDCKKEDREGADIYFSWSQKWIDYLDYLDFRNNLSEEEYLDFSHAGNGLDFKELYEKYVAQD
ncbi:hypothetical protein UT300003_32260 [Clostridium sardiniense]